MSQVLTPDGSQGLRIDVRGGPTDPSHDEKLRRGIIETETSRSVTWTLSLAFIALVAAVPASQLWLELVDDQEPLFLELFRRAPTAENLRQFEEDLENTSYAKEWVQPKIQLLLARYGREGNEKAVVGHSGWLYYTPGIHFLGGPGFLEADALAQKRLSIPGSESVSWVTGDDPKEDPIEPDPRPAILAFHQELTRRGITLMLFPVPDKAMVEPAPLSGSLDPRRPGTPVPRNPSFARFRAELEGQGVVVFDPEPGLRSPGETPRFLQQDTHWTPTWMRAVARDLAAFITRSVTLPPPERPPVWQLGSEQVARVGDLIDMLKLPEDQTWFLPQAIAIEPVTDTQGNPFEPDPTADVLLLGDSFTNIFSLDYMGWGESAGFGEHLARELGRPLDVIAQNDSGAFATRVALANALAAGEDRLAGKRVVVWEFASRELSVGNWKRIDWARVSGAASD